MKNGIVRRVNGLDEENNPLHLSASAQDTLNLK